MASEALAEAKVGPPLSSDLHRLCYCLMRLFYNRCESPVFLGGSLFPDESSGSKVQRFSKPFEGEPAIED